MERHVRFPCHRTAARSSAVTVGTGRAAEVLPEGDSCYTHPRSVAKPDIRSVRECFPRNRTKELPMKKLRKPIAAALAAALVLATFPSMAAGGGGGGGGGGGA